MKCAINNDDAIDINCEILHFYSQDDDEDDDGFMGGNFEEELANMHHDGDDFVIGDGPENQLTNIKWVRCLF